MRTSYALGALLLLAAGCLDVSPADGTVQCGTGGSCPPGYQCENGFCTTKPGGSVDASTDAADAADASVDVDLVGVVLDLTTLPPDLTEIDLAGADLVPLDLAGTPMLTSDRSSVDIGSVIIGSMSTATITITNTGSAPSGTITITLSGDAAYTKPRDLCNGMILAPNASCEIDVQLMPAAAGTPSGNVRIEASPGGTIDVPLTGTALTPGALTISPDDYTFPAQEYGTSSAAVTFTVTNTGSSATGTPAVSITGSGASHFEQTNTCSSALGAGATCTVDVVFHPTKAGAKTAALTVSATPGGNASTPLRGTVSFAPESDCLDGIDNNGDERIDCADPTCTAIVECVDTPAVGSEIGTLLSTGSCPASYGPLQTYQGGIQIPKCAGCACDEVIGTCQFDVITHIGQGAGCSGGVGETVAGVRARGTATGPVISPVCRNFSMTYGSSFDALEFKGAKLLDTECTTTGTPTRGTPTWKDTYNFCATAKSSQSCGANRTCVAKTTTPTCVRIPNANGTCPSGFATATAPAAYVGYTDNRSCAACGCKVEGGACTNPVAATIGASCSTQTTTVTADANECARDTANISSVHSYTITKAGFKGGACAASALTNGNVVLNGGSTLCCR